MKLEAPLHLSTIRITLFALGAALVALGIYALSGLVWLSTISGLFAVPTLVILERVKLNHRHRNYLTQFGLPFDGEITDEIYENSILGFALFEGRAAHVIVFADENGILIRKRAVHRLVTWESIVGASAKQFRKHPIIELNIGNLEAASRLRLPWPQKLQHAYEKYAPQNS